MSEHSAERIAHSRELKEHSAKRTAPGVGAYGDTPGVPDVGAQRAVSSEDCRGESLYSPGTILRERRL